MIVWVFILAQVISSCCFPSQIGYFASNIGATSYEDTLFIAGGNFGYIRVYDTFQSINFTDGSIVTSQMSTSRLWASLVQVQDWVIVAGYNITVDMYSISQQKFIPSNHTFTTARNLMSVVSLGDLAFFAGGNSIEVEIYNATEDSWSIHSLDPSSVNVGATTYKDTAVFLGSGLFYTYNLTTNQWNVTSVPAGPVTMAITKGTKGYFLGSEGLAFIYDFEENSWKNLTLAYSTLYVMAPLGDLIIFGPTWQPSAPFSVYNTTSGSWEEDYIPSQYRGSYVATTVTVEYAEIALFIGGLTNVPSNVMDEYSYCSVNDEYTPDTSYSYCIASLHNYNFTSTTTSGTLSTITSTTTTSGETNENPTNPHWNIIIPTTIISLLLVVLVIGAVCIRRRKAMQNDYTGAHYSLIVTSQPTVIKNVTITQLLGHGQFSEVYAGMWNKFTPVALKKLKSQQDMNEFEREVGILCSLNHPNCVRLYGIYEENGEKMMVLEYLPLGDLGKLLQLERFTYLDLLKMYTPHVSIVIIFRAQHIISGMCYLTDNHILHRDLALRNILVTKQNEGKYIAKVSDFGLSRIENSGYYRTDNKTLAVKWAALESIQYGRFSTKSDVWSFGICLWELMSYGKVPYAGWLNADVIQKVTEGYRLPCPENCPNEVYEVMTSCWNEDPSQRPTFGQLAEVFSGFVHQCSSHEETVMADVIETFDEDSDLTYN